MLSSSLLSLVIVLCEIFQIIHGQVKYFGSSDQYVCHCDGDCDVNTGECHGSCERGWMGPSCQYVNLATGESVYMLSKKPYAHRGRIVDGDDFTCQYGSYGAQQWVKVQMTSPKWISWMQLKSRATHSNKIKNMYATVTDSGTSKNCTSSPAPTESALYSIFCDDPIYASEVEIKITLHSPAYIEVCEVFVSGGLNIALKHPASQTSNYSDSVRTYTADLAVDGISSQDFRDNSCTHTGTQCTWDNQLNWDLDLQGSYGISMVRIYNRNGNEFQLAGFILKTRSTDGFWRALYTDPSSPVAGKVDPGKIVDIVPFTITQANSVRITIPRCQVLSLCEVQIFSDCPDGTYAYDCSGTCRCKDPSESCNKVTGFCSSGCPPGYTGEGCAESCAPGRYGDDCQEICTNCREILCAPVDGNCLNGCGPGWQNINTRECNIACPNGTFGQDCNFTCRCSDASEVCDKISGTCSSGCAAGYKPPDCQQKCEKGKYGRRCSFFCGSQCLNDVCDHVNGTCYMGCKAGYMGDLCFDSCTKDFYGVNCSGTCSENCKPYRNPNRRSCDKQTGRCLRGCQPGWTSEICNTTCTSGWYGAGCSYRCSRNCKDRACHHVNGSCISGCIDGKQGEMCRQDCSPGTYGPDCRFNCSIGCKGGQCSASEGFCSSGCSPGWLGKNCSLECPSGFYGDQCKSECSTMCEEGACDNVNGDCTQGCISGFKGKDCSQQCESGTYGPSCRHTCGQGCEGGQCNRTDGGCTCSGGWRGQNCDLQCEAGYYGQDCLMVCNTNCQGSLCNEVHGKCLSCRSGWKGELCQEAEGMSTSVIAGIAVACVVIIVLALLIAVFIVRRKPQQKNSNKTVRYDNTPSFGGSSERKITIQKTTKTAGDLSNGNVNDVYYNIAATSSSSTVVTVNEFPEYVKRWRLNRQHLYEEFQKLPKDLTCDTNVASAPHNVRKNRYKNICAYDHSRVVLQTDPKDPDVGDYINACYIDTPKREKSFIASQGPNDVIMNDFIRMLWECNSQKVVMLTKLFEEGKQKSHQYWPDDGEITFSNITVSIKKTIVRADYTIRKLIFTKSGSKPRHVTQFHYTAWPDKGVPRSAASLLDFRDKVMTPFNHNPVVVHCSAGIGRTGTFIALQYLKEEAELRATQDIYTCVWNLRQQRVNMVQTKDQYVFLHEACLMSLITTASSLSQSEFRKQYSNIVQDTARLQREFKTLEEFPVKTDEDEFSVALKQQTKNRHSTVLAGNSTRPVLTPNPDYEETSGTYINAVFMPSFDAAHKFVQTQSPLPSTVADMWRLVTDYDVDMIFMLDNYAQDDGDAAVYWPGVRCPLEVGPYRVECITASQNEEVVVRNLELKQGEFSKKLVHLTAKFWSNDSLPSVASLLQLLKMLKTKKSESPVIVHCRSGTDRSGLFCAVAAIIDRINIDHTVAIPVVVGNSKAIRPQNIPDTAQYKYCYEAAAEYLGPEPVYSNTENESGTAEMEEPEDANVYSNIENDEHIYSNQ